MVEFMVEDELGNEHQPGPVLQGVVDALVEFHDEAHAGTFRFCDQAVCREVRHQLGGDVG